MRQKSRLLSADAAANFDNHILVVIWVARQEENRQLLRKLIAALLRLGNLLLEHRLHLGVRLGKQSLILFDGQKRLLIGAVRLDDGSQSSVFTRITLPLFHICHHCGVAEQGFQFAVFIRNGIQFA